MRVDALKAKIEADLDKFEAEKVRIEVEKVRIEEEKQRDEEKEKFSLQLAAGELEAKMNAQMNDKLLDAETSAKLGLQREKSSFMAALHEVRNPLNGIVLTLEHIDESLSAQIGGEEFIELREELETIKTCAGHQTLLLKSIMDLDKIMAGNQELPREDFNPAQVCSDALAINKHAAKSGVSIELNASSGANAAFIGAPTQLNLVLVNLMSNALKFTKAGKVVLSVAVLPVVGQVAEDGLAEDGHANHPQMMTLRFAVTDTGPGVPTEQQESIFGMRGQAGNEISQAKGFGFGLFVAHELVERMGGEIVLQSPVVAAKAANGGGGGGGSEFSFEINVGKSANLQASAVTGTALDDRLKSRFDLESVGGHAAVVTKEEEAAEKETFGEVLTLKGWKVLLVDDSDINLRLLSRKFAAGPFKKLGWTVETAATGEEALEKISETSGREGERRRYDLVVSDQNMQPEGILLGTEMSDILRKDDERVLFIGLTGNSTDEDRKRSKESGQDMFWSKPAPPSKDAFDDITSMLVKRRRKNREKQGKAAVKVGEGKLGEELRQPEAAVH